MEILIEIVGKRIHLRGSRSGVLLRKCQRVPGHGYSKTKSAWTFPLDWGTCKALRVAFGDTLVIGPALTEWAEAERERNEKMEDLAVYSGEIRELPGVAERAPKLHAALMNRSYQTVGASYIAHGRRVLIGDEPGMGKTLETLAGIVEADLVGPMIIFCPVSAMRSVWEDEIHRWLPDDDVFVATGTKAHREKVIQGMQYYARRYPAVRMWLVCNIEMSRIKQVDGAHEPMYPALFEGYWSAIVVDESHRALITRSSLLKKMTQVRAGMHLMPRTKDGIKVALSGTPWRGRVENSWGTLNWLWPEKYNSYWRWVGKYFEVVDNYFGKDICDVLPEMEDEFMAEQRTVMLRRTKAECLPDLPPKAHYDVWLDMEPAQAKAYANMVKDAKISGGMLTSGVLAELGRLRQLASSAGRVVSTRVVRNAAGYLIEDDYGFVPDLPSNKFEWLVDFLAARGIEKDNEGGDAKVIVTSESTQLLELFAEGLRGKGIDSYMLSGKVNARNRRNSIKSFQEDGGHRVFFLNKAAGGVAVTLDAADDVVFLDDSWIPDTDEQVADRAHRASKIHQVNIWHVRSRDTIEETIAQQNISLDEIQKKLMDGSRGVDFARLIMGIV